LQPRSQGGEKIASQCSNFARAARLCPALLAETARYRDTERDLCIAGVDAKMFDTEDAAARWLDDSAFNRALPK